MSLLFNIVSRFVIAFLPRSNCFLISQLQSPSIMTSEPKKIKSHYFLFFPIYLPWSDGTIELAAKSLQSCAILCNPIHGSPPGSPVPGILQARTLEWVAISFSSAWKWKVKVKSLSHVQLFKTPWTVAHQAPPSMGFARQEYCSGAPLPSPTTELKAHFFTLLSPPSTGSLFLFAFCH